MAAPAAGLSKWTKVSNKYCAGSGSVYSSASAAEAACISSKNCSAIYDQKCDGVGGVELCKANSLGSASWQGSCVYLKPAGAPAAHMLL